MFFFCVFTQTTRFFFSLFSKEKRPFNGLWAQSESDSFDRSFNQNFCLPRYPCTLGSTVCVRRSLYWAQRFLFLSPSTDEAKKHTQHHPARHTHTHHSTAQRSHEAEFSAKTSEEEKNSNNRAARCRKSERRRQPSLHLISGDERRGGNKSFQGETSTTNPRLCAQFFFFRVHRRMTEIKYARNEHIPSGSWIRISADRRSGREKSQRCTDGDRLYRVRFVVVKPASPFKKKMQTHSCLICNMSQTGDCQK